MKKVLILFGGQSTEHEISCLSAASVLRNIDRDIFEVTACGITKNGDTVGFPDCFDCIDEIENGAWAKLVPEGAGFTAAVKYIEESDVVFPVMHGIMAEDGTVQGLVKLLKKPCVGPGVLASAVCMDKVYTKIVLDAAGIPQAKAVIVKRGEFNDEKVNEIETKLGYPCFVKPSNSGSSVGAFKVKTHDELIKSVNEAAKYDTKVLVEEYVNGKEVECAVLGNKNPKASTPGEIVSTSEFYDYDDKYKNGTSSTRIPADIPEDAREKIRELAVKAYVAADCAGLSRVDFFYDKENNRVLLNEINTLPGFTQISMYAKMWAHDGVDFKALVTKLIELAEEDYELNKKHYDA